MSKILTMAFTLGANAALACVPQPGEVYDSLATLPNNAILIGMAEVSDIHFFTSEPNKACFTTQYTKGTARMGAFPEQFAVTTCQAHRQLERWQAELEGNAEFTEVLGYSIGAEVVVGLVAQPEDMDIGYRYFVPSCWGAMHLRIDTLADGEKDAFLSAVDDMIDSFQEKTQ
ncbi:hypothetical protein [uncultured Pelagimonas sp.]|uniref:hypothetical protein n=1 Tax=uncultured Pelagimonas sp. TaxID=1618102 RepID=UPI0026034E91|nr:hypothetical protein [uncultured Pelagimonas sp.]